MIFEWLAYSQLEPFGPRREDLRAGVVAATVQNMLRGKGARALKATDFLKVRPVHATTAEAVEAAQPGAPLAARGTDGLRSMFGMMASQGVGKWQSQSDET